MAPQPEDAWRLERRRQLGSEDRASIYANTYRLPDGSVRADYYVVDERGGALVVALTDADQVLLVGQYRAPVDAFLWELPAGALESGETDPLARAQAELLEETGYEARQWHAAGTFYAAPHRSTEFNHCFLALGARRTHGQDLDPGESVRVRRVPVRQVPRMIDRGEICSGPHIVALHLALRLRERLRRRG